MMFLKYLEFLNSNCVYGKYRVLNISEVRFKVSMAMSPSQRPRGVLGFWASLMTALGNTENMPVSILILLCNVSWSLSCFLVLVNLKTSL